ncbi:hypothetical protein F511_43481 [Dorcoceras hygrometricum]|uniref:Uncharacterized protein n=1 Tax=Dorcoceras hygrometricum TaxID=472368 RepID=A0A2Z7ANK1_9LAMI|nr:hypothetical protein F511_43481 [Dorcoceras hygrometricum]
MLAGFITEEAEADTVADQGLKRVNRIFGGLNEGIWPKTEELTKIYEVCWKKCRRKKMNSRCLESVAQDLVSAMMTSAYLLEKATSSNVDAQRIEERAKCSSRRNISAAKQLTIYERCLSTAELNSKWRKRQKPAKEKDASTVLVSVLYRGALHQNGKKTRQPSGALKSFWKLSNGKKFSRGYIFEATPIEEVVKRVE